MARKKTRAPTPEEREALAMFEQAMEAEHAQLVKFRDYCLEYRQYCEWQIHKISADYRKTAAVFEQCMASNRAAMEFVYDTFSKIRGDLYGEVADALADDAAEEEADPKKATIH